MTTPSPQALKDTLTHCLAISDEAAVQIFALLNYTPVAGSGPEWFFEELEQARASLGSWAEIGKRLKLNDAGMSQFTLLLRHFQQLVPGSESAQSATPHQVIAALRYVSWLEKMREKQPALKWTASLPASDAESQFQGKAQIRAVELMLRQLISRAWPDKAKLSTHLTTLLGVSAVKRSQSKGEKGDIISGLMFSELASVLVDKREFNRFYAPVFNSSSQGFLVDQRKTLQAFLDEIRLMRNQVVSRQPLSAVQLALLENYVHEITEPVQKAYREGRTKVDPSAFQHADPAELGQFFQKNGTDTGAVQDSLQKEQYKAPDVASEPVNLLATVLWSAVGVALVAILGVGIFLLTHLNRDNQNDGKLMGKRYVGFMKNAPSGDVTGPRLELKHQGIDWTPENFRSAIMRGDRKVVRQFLEGGMTWQASWAEQPLARDQQDVLELLINFRSQMDEPEPCRRMISTISDAMARGESLTSMRKTFLETFCWQSDVVEQERQAWQQALQREKSGVGGAVKWSDIHEQIYDTIR